MIKFFQACLFSFLMIYLQISYAADNLSGESTDKTIQYKQVSDITTDKVVDVSVYVIVFLLLAALFVYFIKKQGYLGSYNIIAPAGIKILSVSKLSRKTTVYKIEIDGHEYHVLESSDNIVNLEVSRE